MLDWRVPGYSPLREFRAGTVLARHEASGHPVLLRYHAPEPEPALAARRAQARALAGLASPHVAALYEHVEFALPGQPEDAVGAVTVREYVAGASVRSLLHGSPLPPESALTLLRTGLLALQPAHEAGMTHRGYKPENLLVAADGTARLSDFGIAPEPANHPGRPDQPQPSDRPQPSDQLQSSQEPEASDQPEPPDQSARSAPPEGSAPNPGVADDVRAAFAVFVACLGGRADKLPRRLRGLAAVGASGDGPALLEAVEQAGRAGWGPQWCSRGEQELARRVARARRRRESVA